MPKAEERVFVALRESGMPQVPEQFSVALVHQEIPRTILAEIDAFIRMFDRVTTRPAWQETVTASGPAIARLKRSEVCFFSAWDFHIPREQPDRWQLIECNDNGSGLLFAALMKRVYHEVAGWACHVPGGGTWRWLRRTGLPDRRTLMSPPRARVPMSAAIGRSGRPVRENHSLAI